MKKFYVYVHVCPNGKRYVGCTKQARPELRWGKNGGRYKHQLFGRAILKYGWDNITHEVFEVDSEEEMYRKEIELISFYHSNDPEYGYNNSTGGEKSTLGCIRSEEYRKKQSEVHKGKVLSEETKRKIAETLKGKPHKPHKPHKPFSEETKRRMSEAKKGKSRKPFSEEHRKHMSEVRKGKPKPRIKIQLPDGTIIEVTKQNLTRNYINKGKKFEYLSY